MRKICPAAASVTRAREQDPNIWAPTNPSTKLGLWNRDTELDVTVLFYLSYQRLLNETVPLCGNSFSGQQRGTGNSFVTWHCNPHPSPDHALTCLQLQTPHTHQPACTSRSKQRNKPISPPLKTIRKCPFANSFCPGGGGGNQARICLTTHKVRQTLSPTWTLRKSLLFTLFCLCLSSIWLKYDTFWEGTCPWAKA